eukprot:COSAG06_NODE_2322_length_7086_cov_9.273937_3_plen_66_part_00
MPVGGAADLEPEPELALSSASSDDGFISAEEPEPEPEADKSTVASTGTLSPAASQVRNTTLSRVL